MDHLFWVRAGSLLMLLGVALGAFAAHGLREALSPEARAAFETGVRYQITHALALFVVAWLTSRAFSREVQIAGWCFLFGSLLFSGSLYALSLTGLRRFGAITPLGGLLFLCGWLSLLLAARRQSQL